MTDRAYSLVKEGQRTDAHYYEVARRGYDATTGERGPRLQVFAAKRSKQTRDRLFLLVSASGQTPMGGDNDR